MESIEAYLERKDEELRLLNGCLETPLPLAPPRSLAEVIRHKFQLTAALKAEHAINDWAITETAWAHRGRLRCGPYALTYDYQRADLDVDGPSFYELGDHRISHTVFTISGMAAITALLLASAKLVERGSLVIPPGSYGETQELVEGHVRRWQMVSQAHNLERAIESAPPPRILLLDSSAPASVFEAARHAINPALDLLVFDTTCFSASSRRIRRVIDQAGRCGVPVAMVRSHTKLDSLGAEYGRLGSVAFIDWGKSRSGRSSFHDLPTETKDALRLIGGAALPAHFPPYVGSPAYRRLTNQRMAAILRNTRRARSCFETRLAGLTAELRFAHELYFTLASREALDEAAARRMAAQMADELAQQGLPIRHAGSFGFDFAATEWFRDSATGQYSVRVAVPDLPAPLWDEVAQAIAAWWLRRQEKIAAAS
jgi:hypothetical protein